MAKSFPVTPAIRLLRQHEVEYLPHEYRYVPRGGAAASAEALQVDQHIVVKTLIMEDDRHRPLVVLMHGDRAVSTKKMARLIGVKTVQPCTPEIAQRHSGYQVGGTSPFGTHRHMPVYMHRTIAELERIFINGGKRGFLLELSPADLVRVLSPELVDVARPLADG